MSCVDFPIEMWGEISRHDYDVWAALRALNREFCSLISKVDIKGRFDYVYHYNGCNVDISRPFYQKMIATFRRLTFVCSHRHTIDVYKHGVINKTYIYVASNVDSNVNSDLWSIKTIARYRTDTPRVLFEFLWFVDSDIAYYNRNLTLDNVDTCDETFRPASCELLRRRAVNVEGEAEVDTERIVVPIGEHAPYVVNDEWFVYSPVGRPVLLDENA